MPKLMRQDDIPAYVDEIIAIGLEVHAIGTRHYVIDDTYVPLGRRGKVRQELNLIRKQYGDCDHLRGEIIAHLISLGLFIHI